MLAYDGRQVTAEPDQVAPLGMPLTPTRGRTFPQPRQSRAHLPASAGPAQWQQDAAMGVPQGVLTRLVGLGRVS